MVQNLELLNEGKEDGDRHAGTQSRAHAMTRAPGVFRAFLLAFLLLVATASIGAAQDSSASSDTLSLDSLLNTDISSTAKHNESVNDGSAAVTAAAKYRQSAHEAPASITIITSNDIQVQGYQTLEDVLQMVRGFYVSNDRDYAYLGVRGFSRPTDYNDRIVLLLNGHPMNENVYGSALVGTEMGLDLEHVDRIEIVRGPGSALYGTNAMFAVINIVTKSGSTVDGVNAHLDAGSYGHVGGGLEAGRHYANGLDWSASGQWANLDGQRLYFPEYDDPETNNGYSDNNDGDRYYAMSGVTQYKQASVQASFSERTKAVPTGAYDTEFNHDGAFSKDCRSFLEFKLNHQWGSNRQLMGRLYYDNYRFNGSYPYTVTQHDRSNGDWAGGEAQFRWDLRVDNRLILGVEHQNNFRADYKQWDADTVYFDGNFPFTLWSGYLQDEARISRALSVTAGIRHDYNSTVGSVTTPRGAIVLSPPRAGTFKLLYGEAFRAPNVFEREIGGGEEVKGNPNLGPERIRTYELAWECKIMRGLRGALSLFHYKMFDLIDPGIGIDDSLTVYSNVSGASSHGAEAELERRWGKGTSMMVSYSYQKTIESDADGPLTNSPQHTAKFVGVLPVGQHVILGLRELYESRRLTVYETWTKPYFVSGITLTLRPRITPATAWGSLAAHAALVFTVNNIFDANYSTPGGLEHRQPAIMQNGRNVLLKLRLAF